MSPIEHQSTSVSPINATEFPPVMEIDDEDPFASRQRDGTYDEVLQQMENLKSLALAAQEYEVDFFRNPEPDKLGCYKYIDANHEEMTTILCGQVCHSEYGTAMGAAGSYGGDQMNVFLLSCSFGVFIYTFRSPFMIQHQSKIE